MNIQDLFPLGFTSLISLLSKGLSRVFSNTQFKSIKLKRQHFGHLMWRGYSWKRPWCWKKLRAGGEEGIRGWDGWMISPTQWTWVWAKSRRWWRTGKPGVLQSMGWPRVWHSWASELNWTEVLLLLFALISFALADCSKKILLWFISKNVLPVFSSRHNMSCILVLNHFCLFL